MRGSTGLNKALHVAVAGGIVAVTTWDVNRHVGANRVPVTKEQEQEIHEWKAARKRELEEASSSSSMRFMETLALTGGAGDDSNAKGNVRGRSGNAQMGLEARVEERRIKTGGGKMMDDEVIRTSEGEE
jgi:hypothetical protein